MPNADPRLLQSIANQISADGQHVLLRLHVSAGTTHEVIVPSEALANLARLHDKLSELAFAKRQRSATLCSLMKNEGPYILEWVAYHKNLGFDRIVIYDNESTDSGARVMDALGRAGDHAYSPARRFRTQSTGLGL
jgi:hypothetical protein